MTCLLLNVLAFRIIPLFQVLETTVGEDMDLKPNIQLPI